MKKSKMNRKDVSQVTIGNKINLRYVFISTLQRNLLIRLSPSFLPVSQMLSCQIQSTYDYFSSPADQRTTMYRYAKLHCEVACIISTLNVLIVLHLLYETAITILFWLIDNASTSCLCALSHDWRFVLSWAFQFLKLSLFQLFILLPSEQAGLLVCSLLVLCFLLLLVTLQPSL